MPAAHSEQLLDPSSLVFPLGHGSQSELDDPPLLGLAEPAWQALQALADVAPVWEDHRPLGQLRQLFAPVMGM